jgi:hypothetical protein
VFFLGNKLGDGKLRWNFNGMARSSGGLVDLALHWGWSFSSEILCSSLLFSCEFTDFYLFDLLFMVSIVLVQQSVKSVHNTQTRNCQTKELPSSTYSC